MRRSIRPTLVKFGIFGMVMAVMTACLFFIFGQYQTGSTKDYSAVFKDASRLKVGQSVRVGGMRVGTVNSVKLQKDKTALVTFDADPAVQMTTGTQAAVRYLNLVGDRYLELIDGPGDRRLPPGSQIPAERTQSALDLDLLLGGLKPVIRGLNPQDVNALSASLIQIFQGQGGTLQSLLSNTSGFTTALAEHNQTIQALIDNLRTLLSTLSKEGDKFSGTIAKLETLVTALAAEKDPIGTAIESLNNGTASVADLLTDCSTFTQGHRRPVEPVGHQHGRPEGPARRHTAEGAGELPQTDPHRVLRQLLQLLHLRTQVASDRPSGPHRRVPVDQARRGEVYRALMLKYRGNKLIRTGFMGVVLCHPDRADRALP